MPQIMPMLFKFGDTKVLDRSLLTLFASSRPQQGDGITATALAWDYW